VGNFINASDLAPFADIEAAKAAAMIEDAEAQATLTAPCLSDLAMDDPKRSAVKSILRGAILRWNEAGSGAVQTTVAGPYSQTVQYQARRSMFWPTEIEQLQGLCASDEKPKVFAVDTVAAASLHLPWCSLNFGATYCSCGVDIAGEPIFEGA
jgi:hypothetical protein